MTEAHRKNETPPETQPAKHPLNKARVSPLLQAVNRVRALADLPRLWISGQFDAAYYQAQNTDLSGYPLPVMLHFLWYGAREGRNPNPFFDVAYYLASNPDVKQSGRNPLVHFLMHGLKEGRKPHACFDHMPPASRRSDDSSAQAESSPWWPESRREGFRPDQPAVLVIDLRYPMPDHDSGSVRMMGILDALIVSGRQVTFISDLADVPDAYRAALKAKGIFTLTGKTDGVLHLKHYGRFYQTVLISRPDAGARYLLAVKAFAAQAQLIYDTVDLHWVRRLRQADVEEDPRYAVMAHDDFQKESTLIRRADRVLAITGDERDVILQHWPETRVHLLHNIHEITPLEKIFQERRGLMFIGGFEHAPNGDAMRWFVGQVLPLIQKVIPDVTLSIVGSRPPPDILALQSESVSVLGFVPDVSPCFAAARVFAAPIRAGAGMKGKIGQAMACGLPVVTTGIGAEGMLLKHEEHALIADTAEDFAREVVRLYQDETLWKKLREKALRHIEDHFSPNHARRALNEILSPLTDGAPHE